MSKNSGTTTVSASQAVAKPALRRPRLLRSGLARDVTFAMLAKIVLLSGLIVAVSRLAIQTPNSAAATAQAVAGISGPGELAR